MPELFFCILKATKFAWVACPDVTIRLRLGAQTARERSFMVKKNQYGGSGNRSAKKQARTDRGTVVREVPVFVRKEAVEYGKPFIVMEDSEKNTFAYDGSAWVPYGKSIADCKADGQVKVLPQKVNGKTRYEVRQPVVARG